MSINLRKNNTFSSYKAVSWLILTSFCCVSSNAEGTQLLFADSDLKAPVSTRKFDKAGGQVSVWIDSCTTSEEISFKETERSTQIASDFQQIIKKIAGAAAPRPACVKDEKRAVEKRYTLKYDRSTVKIKATGIDDGAGSEEVTVITGNKEKWYLGVDLPVNNSKTLKYDSASHSLVPQGTGHQLYLSINYFIGGDLFARDAVPAAQRFSGKLFIAAQSRPFDSVGLGVGYRLPKFDAINLNSFEIFAGRFWTAQDKIDAGTASLNTGRKANWRFGVSYNLSDGLGWVSTK